MVKKNSNVVAELDVIHQDTNFEMIKEFHRVFGRTPDPKTPTIPNDDSIRLRWSLIQEEMNEVFREMFYYEGEPKTNISLPKLAKELADLLYVVYGTGAAFGIDLDAVFLAVHESNMSKLDKNGKVIRREDGKVLKGPLYKEPNIEHVLEQQVKIQDMIKKGKENI